MTLAPRIYAPDAYFDFRDRNWGPVLNHENWHLARQLSVGRWKWIWRYLVDRKFRLAEEVQGIAIELSTLHPEYWPGMRNEYAIALSSRAYWWAADSWEHAMGEITAACAKIGTFPGGSMNGANSEPNG